MRITLAALAELSYLVAVKKARDVDTLMHYAPWNQIKFNYWVTVGVGEGGRNIHACIDGEFNTKTNTHRNSIYWIKTNEKKIAIRARSTSWNPQDDLSRPLVEHSHIIGKHFNAKQALVLQTEPKEVATPQSHLVGAAGIHLDCGRMLTGPTGKANFSMRCGEGIRQGCLRQHTRTKFLQTLSSVHYA